MSTAASRSAATHVDPATAWFWEQAAAAPAPDARDELLVLERSARRGAMPPLHARDAPEAYRVVDGEVTFFVGGEIVRARAGEVVVAPGGAERSFRVESPEARWLVLTRVRCAQRFRDFTRAVAPPGAASGWPSAEERHTVAALGRANGIELLGPPGAVPVAWSRPGAT